MVGGARWAAVHGVATEQLPFHFSLSHIGEGNGNPLQCSCLENPRDGGAWWAAVYGVAQNRTRLKWLSSSSSSSSVSWGFPGGSSGKEPAFDAGDPGLIPGSGRSPEEGIGYPLWYSCWRIPMNRGARWATVHGDTTEWLTLWGFPGGSDSKESTCKAGVQKTWVWLIVLGVN